MGQELEHRYTPKGPVQPWNVSVKFSHGHGLQGQLLACEKREIETLLRKRFGDTISGMSIAPVAGAEEVAA